MKYEKEHTKSNTAKNKNNLEHSIMERKEEG